MNISFNSYRHFKSIFALFFALVLVVQTTSTAHADPHAMFYTVSGQQQLFFNTLAALDQADYVEPAKNTTGAPAGTSRDELLKSRTSAGFGAENNSILNSTHTNLSGIVTRNITLEGNDVWSSYLLTQFSLERSRTTNSNELVKIFCERGLGLKDCQDTVQARKGQEKVFDANPQVYAAQPAARGAIGVLSSGLEEYEKVKNDALENNSGPLPFNPQIAGLRDNNKGNESKKNFVEGILEAAGRAFTSSVIDPNALNDLTIVQNGDSFEISYNPPSQSQQISAEEYMKKVQDVIKLPSSLLEIGISNQIAMEKFYDSAAVTGAGGGKGGLETYESNGAVGAKVTIPAGVVDRAAQEPISQISTFEGNRVYASANQNSLPEGNQPLVPAGQDQGNVAGVSSDKNSTPRQQETNGQVLGIDDQPSQTSPLDPQSLPQAFYKEESPKDYLEVLLGTNNGCGCNTNNALNDFGQVIIRKINGL